MRQLSIVIGTLVLTIWLGGCFSKQNIANAQVNIDISGTWVNVDYLLTAIKSKSGVEAFKTFRPKKIAALDIRGHELPLECWIIGDAHTGGVRTLANGYSKSDSTYSLGDATKTYYQIKVSGLSDTLLLLRDLELNLSHTFSKISSNTLSDPFARALNIVLFAGKYRVLDSLGNEILKNVELKSDGSISNFDQYSTYEVWVDYAADPSDEPCNWITFDKEGMEYEFKGPNFALYERIETGNDSRRGSMRYLFIRQQD